MSERRVAFLVALVSLAVTACRFSPALDVEREDSGVWNGEDAASEATDADTEVPPDDGSYTDLGVIEAGRDAEAMDAIDATDAMDAGAKPDLGFPIIPHLAAEGQHLGMGDLVLSGGTIDTSSLTYSRGPDAVDLAGFTAEPQWPSGPELAVLRVGKLEIRGPSIVRVIGRRPLVIVAAADVNISGTLDASADGMVPGAGSSSVAAGSSGTSSDSNGSSGGGGAGHATSGAAGGACCDPMHPGGAGGEAFGVEILSVLRGGASGGAGGNGGCDVASVGGGGGGAVQIYSATKITIAGLINVSGGGGQGGVACSMRVGAGAGGGSGGSIFLRSLEVDLTGQLAANGGGGGGGGGGGRNPEGTQGADGTYGVGTAAGGGSSGMIGGAGGAGASIAQGPSPGDTKDSGNGGGGGGAVGRIRIEAGRFIRSGRSSPAYSFEMR